jgi:hypothetical protein
MAEKRTCVNCDCLVEKIPGEFVCTMFDERTVSPENHNADDCEYFKKDDTYIWE